MYESVRVCGLFFFFRTLYESDRVHDFRMYFCNSILSCVFFACCGNIKVENNPLELTRIFKENILTNSEREKKYKGGEER